MSKHTQAQEQLKRCSEITERARQAFASEPYNWTEVLKVMTARMEQHGWWSKLDGTPLKNDLPVIAATAFFDMAYGQRPLASDAEMNR